MFSHFDKIRVWKEKPLKGKKKMNLLNEWMAQWKADRKATLVDLIQLEKDIAEGLRNPVSERVVDYITRQGVKQATIKQYDIRGHIVEKSIGVTFREIETPEKQILSLLGYSQYDFLSVKHYGRTVEWAEEQAEKDMQRHKKQIEAKVEKVCGRELTHIKESGSEIMVRGSNNKVARIFAIRAGGYNIQCLHIRVLVKEVR